ncbi:MAG: lectin like domain-containing protein [Holophagaceae bacterium]|nr:lectin like domain-containing protein [Holophagaceae bacterium]
MYIKNVFTRIFALVLGLASAGILAAQATEPKPSLAPLNPAFLKWQAEQRERAERMALGLPVEPKDSRLGYIPPTFVQPKLSENRAPLTQIEAMVKSGLASFDTYYDPSRVGAVGNAGAASFRLDPTYVLSIRNQGRYGTCWAHAALASMESNILVNGGNSISLSPWHLAYYTYNPINSFPAFTKTDYDGHETFDQGGNFQMALAIMSRGPGAGGAVSEAGAPYGVGTPSAGASSVATVKNAYYLGDEIWSNREAVKGMVVTYGAVAISYYMDEASEYYNRTYSTYRYSQDPKKMFTNHGVNIVGWDDNFDRTKFPFGGFGSYPATNGAWIVRNSWGSSWGEGGYFYISYDTPLSNFHSFEATRNLDDHVYQYDPHGKVGTGVDATTAWFSNIFTADGNHRIKAIAFHTSAYGAQYEITIRTSVGSSPGTGSVVLGPVSGTATRPGYQRIELSTPVAVSADQRFSVIVKLTETGTDSHRVGLSYAHEDYSESATASPGRGFVSTNGSYWYDVRQYFKDGDTVSVCLKAFAETANAANPVSFTVAQTGGSSNSADTTGIVLAFSRAVAGLTADDITITNGTGSATKGSLSGSGAIWTIGVTVGAEGTVNVGISDFGDFQVTSPPRSVAVYKSSAKTPVTFTATQTGGSSNSADTTGIVLAFSQAVTGLTAGGITITNGTGSVIKGSLSGSGAIWTIGVTVGAEGTVNVGISDFGDFQVTSPPMSVAVYKSSAKTPVTFTATQTGGSSNSADTTGIVLAFSQAVTGLTAGSITITNGTGSVIKGSLSGSGAIWTIGVTVGAEGTVNVGISDFGDFQVTNSPQSVAVYKGAQAYISIVDPPSTMLTGETVTFRANVIGIANKAVAWSVAGGGNINSSTGAYTAPNTAASAIITATSVGSPLITASVAVKIMSTAFDGNSKTNPQLLDLANAFGSTSPADLTKYDLNGDGKIDDEDIRILFKAMGW